MSSSQGVDTGDRISKYSRESRNRRAKERRRGEGPLPGVYYLIII